MATPHAGSWFGLPDFGITEKIGSVLNAPRTSQGGSNVFGSAAPRAQTAPQQSVLGTSSPIYGPVNPNTTYNAPRTSSPAQQQSYSAPAPSGPSPEDLYMQEVNNTFGDAYGRLNTIESDLRAQLPGQEQQINDQFTPQYSQLSQFRDENLNANSQQQEGVRQNEYNVISDARRLFNELGQGVRQRFGGANSAGEFAQAFMGREMQRNIGQAQNTAGTNIQNLLGKAQEITKQYQVNMQQLDAQKSALLAQAREAFQNRLMEINNTRLGLDQNKSQLKLQALQDLRNRAYQIEDQARQYSMNLQQQVAQAVLGAQGAVQAYKAQAGAPVNLNAFEQAVAPYMNYGAGSAQAPQMIGQYTGTDTRRRDQFGNIIG